MAAIACGQVYGHGGESWLSRRWSIRLFSQHDVQDAQAAVAACCSADGAGGLHWHRDAVILLVGVALHLAYADGSRASLYGMRCFLDDPGWQCDAVGKLKWLVEYPHDSLLCAGWVDTQTRLNTKTHPAVVQVARLLLSKPRESIVATVQVARGLLGCRFFPAPLMSH